jgi:RimJ/RimL family protein N-acetyltransferase
MLSDADFIINLVNSPGWLKFIGDRNIHNTDQAINYLENGPLKSYKENEYGLCIVETKEAQISIGLCGLIKRDYLNYPDIGFAYLPEFMGLGYAYEMAKAIVEYSNSILSIETIQAIVKEQNQRSIHLLEKIGMNFVKTLVPPNEETELLLYQLSSNILQTE